MEALRQLISAAAEADPELNVDYFVGKVSQLFAQWALSYSKHPASAQATKLRWTYIMDEVYDYLQREINEHGNEKPWLQTTLASLNTEAQREVTDGELVRICERRAPGQSSEELRAAYKNAFYMSLPQDFRLHNR